jgi:DNA-binding winged helix-turn-helix (wHTH) protein
MIFEFSSFILNENNFSLTKNQKNIEVEPKIFNLLCFFCKNPQRAISREELIECIWQGRIVSDAAINRAISELRKIIELDTKNPQFITTVSKIGYRFSTDVEAHPHTPPNEKPSLIKDKKCNRNLSKANFALVAVCLLGIILFTAFFQKPATDKSSKFSISSHEPLTTIKGNAFKQKIFKNGDALFLHRNKKHKQVQLWWQPANLTAVKLTNDSYYYTHAIFQDANTILATRFDNLKERNCQIVKVTISSKHIEKITNCAKKAVTHLAYSALSRKLYFNFREQVSQPYSIRSIQLDTMRIQQLTNSNPEGNTRGDYLFSLSPNGKEIAVFEYQQDAGAMLKVVDLSNTKAVKHYKTFYSVSGLDWLDKKTILISDKDGIESFDLITKKHHQLLQGENITQADYSQHLSLLSYVKFDATRNIYQLTHNHKSAEPLTHSPYTNFHPTYANTSDALVYLSTDSGKFDVQLTDQKGKTSPLDFPTPIKHIGNLKWAKDDSFILASINSKLYQYSLQMNEWQEIKVNLKNIHYTEVMNNRYSIVSSDQSGDWQLWEVELASGNVKQITKNGGYSANYIASNNTLLISKYSQEGLFQLNLNTQLETKIKANFKITDWNKWQIRGDNLYSWKGNDIVRRNLNTNEEITMWKTMAHSSDFFSINFNESKFAYKVTEHEKSSVWKSTLSVGN